VIDREVLPIYVKADEGGDTHRRHPVVAVKDQSRAKLLRVLLSVHHQYRLNPIVIAQVFPQVLLGLVLETRHREQ
jgi:hypothetical protein